MKPETNMNFLNIINQRLGDNMTKPKYSKEDIELEAALSRAANEEGTIQAGDMLQFTSDPKLHTTISVSMAFKAITGKPYDIDFFCN